VEKNFFLTKDLFAKFPFGFCVQDEQCSRYFRKFTEENQCSENLLFYESVLRFKNVQNINLKRQTCLMIIQGFLLVGSVMELNITKEEKYKAALKFESLLDDECPDDFFNEFLPNITFMLRSESYPKFLRSLEFHEYYSRFGEEMLKKSEIFELTPHSQEESSIFTDVVSTLYSPRGSDDGNEPIELFSSIDKSDFTLRFNFEFCTNDKQCKQYFSRYIGPIFVLHETIQMYKNTPFEKTRNQISMMVISKFLLPNSTLECGEIPKELKNSTIKKFQHLNKSPKGIFDELDETVMSICQKKHELFFESVAFREYYEKFGYLMNEEAFVYI
jgi:hypothetical protein